MLIWSAVHTFGYNRCCSMLCVLIFSSFLRLLGIYRGSPYPRAESPQAESSMEDCWYAYHQALVLIINQFCSIYLWSDISGEALPICKNWLLWEFPECFFVRRNFTYGKTILHTIIIFPSIFFWNTKSRYHFLNQKQLQIRIPLEPYVQIISFISINASLRFYSLA